MNTHTHKRINICVYLTNDGICTGYLRCPPCSSFIFKNSGNTLFQYLCNTTRLNIEKALIYTLGNKGKFPNIEIDIDDVLFIKPLEYLKMPFSFLKSKRVQFSVPGYTLIGNIQHSQTSHWKEKLDTFPKLLKISNTVIVINHSKIQQTASHVMINKKHIISAKEYRSAKQYNPFYKVKRQ